MSVKFLETVFSDSIKNPNFFNGRILTATDLRDEQVANVRRTRDLGQAVGEGVVHGLNVTGNGNTLTITGGLAVNRRGDTLLLPGDTAIGLVAEQRLIVSATSPFAPCDIAVGGELPGSAPSGYYLLALTSATRFSPNDFAPNSGLDGSAPVCTSRYEEVGVQFKLILLSTSDFNPPTADALARSKLAHMLYGTGDVAYSMAAPLSMPSHYGLLDSLRDENPPRLSDCDVPLAAFHYSNQAVQFVDVWAARRPAAMSMLPDAFPSAGASWLPEVFTQFASPRRAIETMAFLLQFQNHLEDVRSDNGTASPEVVAETHFQYLPAAGYLPIQGATSNNERFLVNQFFANYEMAGVLNPDFLRSLFHESFYVEPLVPGQDPIDVYTVEGSSATEAYAIFIRRPVIVIPEEVPQEPEAPEAPQEPEKPEVPRIGNLNVTVLYENGSLVPATMIGAVKAVNQRTGRTYTARLARSGRLSVSKYKVAERRVFLARETETVADKYRSALGLVAAQPQIAIDVARNDVFYRFNNLPVGSYTVHAESRVSTYYGPTKSVRVRANASNRMTVVLRRRRLRDDYWGRFDHLVTPDGLIVDGFGFDFGWKDILDARVPGWLDPDPRVTDPDDWWILDDPFYAAKFEAALAGAGGGYDPRVATSDVEIWIRKGYDPDATNDGVTAFVNTKDGSAFPLVLVAGDNAISRSTPVNRAPFADFDAGTTTRLAAGGLGRLDVMASAPSLLVAAVLGQESTGYARELIGVTRRSVQDDFVNGFMGYSGISREQSNQLKGLFEDRVTLANGSPDEIIEVLEASGGSVDAGFVDRLLLDVQSTVPTSSFALESLGMDAGGTDALAAEGINSIGEFRTTASTDSGRTQLMATLGVGEATLDRYLDGGLVNIAKGQFDNSPDRSLVAVEGVTLEMATRLVESGVTDAKTLANSDATLLAAETNLTEAELIGAIDDATEFSFGFSTLIEGVIGGAVESGTVAEAGFKSIGSLAESDTGTLVTNVGGDVTEDTALKLKDFAETVISVGDSAGGGGSRLGGGGFVLRSL